MPKTHSFELRAFQTPQRLAGMDKSTPVLLALSGGADSVCLLHLLAGCAKRDGFSLTLAHIDHGIRGEDSVRDRRFCQTLADAYGLELCVLTADVPALAEQSGCGLEEEARRVRYAYLETLMREKNIPLLSTAHHADDQIETVLFHLTRGSGLRGLCGIAPVRPFGNGFLTRPLLDVSRAEILQYCEGHELSYVTDETNDDTTYARNRIRSAVVPVLETLFSEPQKRVGLTCASLREDEELLSSLARDALASATSGDGLLIDRMQGMHAALGKRVLRDWILEQSEQGVERAQLQAVWDAIRNGRVGTEITLPSGRAVLIEQTLLRLQCGERQQTEPFCFPFAFGERMLTDSGIRVTAEATKVHNLSTANTINSSEASVIIKDDFYWRSRKSGDVILQGGMHRKLRKLYNAKKISPRMRACLPLLCDGEGIVWAPFIGLRDGLQTQGEGARVRVCLANDIPDGNFENKPENQQMGGTR